MKKIVTFLVGLLICSLVFADVTVTQGVSYISKNGYSFSTSNGYICAYRDNGDSWASTTALNIDTEYVDFDTTFDISNKANILNSNLIVEKAFDNISLFGSTKFYMNNTYLPVETKGRIIYVKQDINVFNLQFLAGINLNEQLWIFDVDMKAYAGYSPFYNIKYNGSIVFDVTNSCVTGFNINCNIWKYFDIYFGIESIQVYSENINFKPLEVINNWGIKAHYDLGNWTFIATYDYTCQHPEVCWSITGDNKYNYSGEKFSLSVSYTF